MNLKELIKVCVGNRKKLHAFEQGVGVVSRFLEYPLMEVKDAHLGIEEPVSTTSGRLHA
jgi:hypothetical protein